jgi:hypothetical protein
MSSSKGLLDLLPPPKSEQTYFKPRTLTTATTSKPTTSTTTTINQAQTKPIQQKFSSRAVISAKPVPNTYTAPIPLSTSSKRSYSTITADHTKIKKTNETNFFGLTSYDSDEEDEEIVEDPVINTQFNHYHQNTVQEIDTTLAEVLKYENKKRRIDNSNISIVDVNIKEVLEKNKEEHLKNLTCEPIKPSRLTMGTGRKHHQITYLAMMAKERDQELNNQWAESKFNRKQSRQRYGF